MMGFGFGGFGLLIMLLLLVVVIAVAVWFVGVLFPGQAGTHSSGRDESALEILQKRYARGELSRSEYEAMRRDLLKDARS
ncbi:MAG: SHOCT domain-containing protein [Caldilineae bacterium]|nr:MAG: SHOCT domain-containing protein [Caldilineae bacterium]